MFQTKEMQVWIATGCRNKSGIQQIGYKNKRTYLNRIENAGGFCSKKLMKYRQSSAYTVL